MLNRLEDVLETALGLPPAFLARRLDALVEGRKFSPVQRYLQELPKLTPDDWADWGKLAEILFGTSDHGSQVKLSRWLIGAVARAMKPGCKMDSALVIRGKQGIGKTSMLQALFGEHFRTLHSSQSQLEQQRNIQGCWGAELGELEATFRAKDISALKAFLTETHDSFRDLQKELKAPRPRHCVLAGTTNETAFLNDSTGSRRFWVIDAGSHNIPVKWVKENRDRIWAVAYSFYLAGEQHWLTAAEAELSELGNKNYETENPFVEPLKTAFDILEAKGMPIAIKASDISQYFLGISPANQKRYSKEVAAALESLGFVKKEFKSQKLSGRFYVRPDATEYVPFNLAMVDHIRSARAYQGRECIQSI
jgi:predicted P-loop ATPase